MQKEEEHLARNFLKHCLFILVNILIHTVFYLQ